MELFGDKRAELHVPLVRQPAMTGHFWRNQHDLKKWNQTGKKRVHGYSKNALSSIRDSESQE